MRGAVLIFHPGNLARSGKTLGIQLRSRGGQTPREGILWVKDDSSSRRERVRDIVFFE